MSVVIDDPTRPIWIDIDRGRLRIRSRYAEHEPPADRTLWAPAVQWTLGWNELAHGRPWAVDDEPLLPLTPDRAGLVELVRRIIEPNVRVAGQFEVDMPWLRADLPLAVLERRRWRSVLAPIHLQLLEGLRRVTEGQRGAAFCRECGEPFLSLDARRSSFCNDQHRFRFSQRERRKRVDAERAVRDAMALRDGANARVDHPGSEE